MFLAWEGEGVVRFRGSFLFRILVGWLVLAPAENTRSVFRGMQKPRESFGGIAPGSDLSGKAARN